MKCLINLCIFCVLGIITLVALVELETGRRAMSYLVRKCLV